MPIETWTRFRKLIAQMKVEITPIEVKSLEEAVLEPEIILNQKNSTNSTEETRLERLARQEAETRYNTRKEFTEEIMNRIESKYAEKNYALVDKMIKATVQTSTESQTSIEQAPVALVEKRIYKTAKSEHLSNELKQLEQVDNKKLRISAVVKAERKIVPPYEDSISDTEFWSS